MRSRPSGSATGLTRTTSLSRISRTWGASETARRWASSMSISGEPVSAECRPAVEHVEGLQAGDQLLGPALVGAPRVGQLGHGRPRLLQVVQALLVAHHHEQDLAALFGLADHLHAHAAGGGGQGAVVGVDLRGARELARRAHDVPEVLRGRGHVRVVRHVGDPGGEEARLGGGRRDGLGRARFRECPGPGRRPSREGHRPTAARRGKGRAGGVASGVLPGTRGRYPPAVGRVKQGTKSRSGTSRRRRGPGPGHPSPARGP